MRFASLAVVLLGLFTLRPTWAEAIVCTATDPQRELTFELDYQNRTVASEVPVNWVWFSQHFVMFMHNVQVQGRAYATQVYTFNATAESLELCDFGSDRAEACSVLACKVPPRTGDKHFATGSRP